MFDFKSIQDFDKHINLSIPSYKNLSNVFSGITCAFAQPESSVVDIEEIVCVLNEVVNSIGGLAKALLIGLELPKSVNCIFPYISKTTPAPAPLVALSEKYA